MGVSFSPGNILKIPPPLLLINMILKLEGMLSFHNPLISYKKLKSPVIKMVGALEIKAAPIAVEVLPSIPLVPQ